MSSDEEEESDTPNSEEDEEVQLEDTSSSEKSDDGDLSNGDSDESICEADGAIEADEEYADDLIAEEKETEEEKKKRSDFVNRVKERLEAQDKRYQRESQNLGEVDAQGNDLLDTDGKRIPAEDRIKNPPVSQKKKKKKEESSDDSDDDPKPSNDDVELIIIKPPTKATRADIIVPLGPAPKYKIIEKDRSLKFSDSEDSDDDDDDNAGNPPEAPSIDEIQKGKMQLVSQQTGTCVNKSYIPSISANRSGTMPPECWWCLFGDRDLERVDADAFHLFEQAYDRAMPRMPKEQLAHYLYRLWKKLIFIPSIEDGRDIPNMTPELFLLHLMFHNRDPKFVQVEQVRTMCDLMDGMKEVFWVRQGVFDPGGGYREQTVPSIKNINTYLKVETRWEALSNKDVSSWMGADPNSTASIRDQRRFDKWGSTRAETSDERRKRTIENNNARERAYKHRRLVLDGGKN